MRVPSGECLLFLGGGDCVMNGDVTGEDSLLPVGLGIQVPSFLITLRASLPIVCKPDSPGTLGPEEGRVPV